MQAVPLLLAGVSTLISVELLGHRFAQSRSLSAVRPFLLATTLAPLIPVWGLAWTGVAIVVAYLAVLEWELRTAQAGPRGVPVAIVGALVGLGISVLEPWAMVAAWATASIWSHARRIVGLPLASSAPLLDVLAAVVPLGLGLALLRALPDDRAWLVMSVVVVAITVAVRWFGSEDRYWAFWSPVSASAVALGAGASWFLGQGSGASGRLLVGAIVLSAASLAGSSSSPVLRTWLTSGALALALTVFSDVAVAVKPLVWAVIGLTAVTVPAVWRRGIAAHLGLVGHLLGLGSLLAGGSPGGKALVLGAWTVGWLTTVMAGEFEGETVSHLLQKVGRGFEGRLGESLGNFGKALPQLVLAASTPCVAGNGRAVGEVRPEPRLEQGSAGTPCRRLCRHRPMDEPPQAAISDPRDGCGGAVARLGGSGCSTTMGVDRDRGLDDHRRRPARRHAAQVRLRLVCLGHVVRLSGAACGTIRCPGRLA